MLTMLYRCLPCYIDAVQVLTIPYRCSPFYTDAHHAIQMLTTLYKCLPCYIDAVQLLTVLYRCSPFYTDAHHAIQMLTMLYKCLPCYIDAVQVLTALYKRSPCYTDTHHQWWSPDKSYCEFLFMCCTCCSLHTTEHGHHTSSICMCLALLHKYRPGIFVYLSHCGTDLHIVVRMVFF